MNFKCRKCGIEKNAEEYPKASNSRGHKATCRKCYNNYYKNYYKENPWQYNKHKGYVKKNDAVYKKQMFRHSLDEITFQHLLNKYEGKCHSCKDELASVIDHDHSCCSQNNKSCGRCVRGLLCNNCNSALGFAKDDVSRLEKMIEYLKHQAKG